MWSAFPTADYYGDSALPGTLSRRRACLSADLVGRVAQEMPGGSHVHHPPFDGIGAQLFPCSLATATPQLFAVASVRTERTSATELRLRTKSTHC